MKAIFVALLSLISLTVFSLPGEPAFGETELIGSCNAHVGVLEGAVLREFMRVSGCQGFTREQTIEYCDCIESLVGNSITTNEEYQKFKDRVSLFDRQETAKARFVNEPRTIKLASMINMLAGDGAEPGPFDAGGKCESQFSSYENKLNENATVKHNLSDLSLHFKEQKNKRILNQNGVNESTLQSFLQDLLVINDTPEETGVGVNHVNYSDLMNTENVFFKLIAESMSIPLGESTMRRRINDRVSGGATSAAISKDEAIEALCMNLAVSFENEVSINQVDKPQGQYIDINSYISEKSLSPIDIPSFRGMKYLFSQTDAYDPERDELFFGQMMCGNIEEELFENSGRSENPEFHNLSKEDLKSQIIDANSFLERTSREYESAVRIEEELEADIKKLIGEASEKFGLTEDQIEDVLKDLNPDNPEFLVAANQLLGQESENVPELSAYLQEIHQKVISYDENQEKRNTFQGLLHEKQMETDDLFKELAYRFSGSVQEAADFIGMDELRSHSIRYFAEFDYNAVGFQGPAVPTHMALNDGETTGYSGDTLRERLRKRAIEVARVGRVIDKIETASDDSKSLSDSTALGNALASIERGSTSKEMFSPIRSGRVSTSRLSRNTKSRGVTPSVQNSNNSERFVPSPSDFKDRGPLTNSERAIIAQKKQLINGSGTGDGETRLVGAQMNSFSPDVITDDTEFGDFLNPTQNGFRDDPSAITSNLEAGLSSLEERLQAMRREQDESAEDREPGPLDAQIEALTAEIEALRKEKERIDRENEEAREELRERERISSTLTDQPAGVVTNNIPAVRTPTRARVQAATASRTEEASGFTAPTISAPVGGGVETGGGGAIADRAPSAYSRRPVIASDDSSAITLNRELTLVNGSMGFIELTASELGSNSVVPINVNFLSLSKTEQVEFMRNFFNERPGEQAYIKQTDGKVVLLNKNQSYTGINAGVKTDDPIVTLERNTRDQAEIVYRMRQLDLILSGAAPQ